MNDLSALVIGFTILSFMADVRDHDLNHLYQNWRWQRYEAASKQQLTYKSTMEFGHTYGYQFRKDKTFSICRGISYFPGGLNTEFDVVDGIWEIEADSIISISYISNNRSYEQQLIIRKLTADELLVRFVEEN